MNYKTIILSDLHLGSKSCRDTDILDFLKNNTCERLILNGDIIEVEHHKGAGEQGIKDAINSKRPEMYNECQQIIYRDDCNKEDNKENNKENNNIKDNITLYMNAIMIDKSIIGYPQTDVLSQYQTQ